MYINIIVREEAASDELELYYIYDSDEL